MPTLEPDTIAGTDLELFEQIVGDVQVPCSFDGCPNEAAWYLLCPYDRSAEPLCDEHRAVLLTWDEDEVIMFNETCKHMPNIGSCGWEPIK